MERWRRGENSSGQEGSMIALKLRENETNASYDAIGGLLMGSQGDKQHWNSLVPRTKDEAVCLILQKA
jgi:hypothetical protein